ncbi:hypothetical protein O181_072019 [Austropuccinia psidii MF-1]|uniref:Uncharacterized protein n=1 Tax=Austropuccinia psidii MF-1 TaxID=1389203 RepID=A0A9Q3F3X2_9BASI|nr:hypothetical protein [Austropuccinia psidii MF-1]
MSSKLTELTESSRSAPPPSVLHSSGILSPFSPPSMVLLVILIPPKFMTVTRQLKVFILLGPNVCQRENNVLNITNPDLQNATTVSMGRSHAVELGNKLLTSGMTGSEQRNVARWTNVGEPIPVGGRPIYSSSEVPISRINTEGIGKRIRLIADSPPYPDAEGSDEFDGEEVEMIPHSSGHPSNISPSQPPAKSSPVPPETSNPLWLQFLLPFLVLHHTLPTPGLP